VGANQTELLSKEVQPPAAPKKGRFISIRTRLLLRFTLVFTLAWGGALLVPRH
jgi:hypothetical protein